ncbi:DUF4389 domain-containing protein [Spongorhabdus nitratireducens]
MSDFKTNLSDEAWWLRLVYLVVFYLLAGLAMALVAVIALIQLALSLVSGEGNATLASVSGGVNRFLFQVMQFICGNSPVKPFPFSDWPDAEEISEPELVPDEPEQPEKPREM